LEGDVEKSINENERRCEEIKKLNEEMKVSILGYISFNGEMTLKKPLKIKKSGISYPLVYNLECKSL